jgi:hypothetical protein
MFLAGFRTGRLQIGFVVDEVRFGVSLPPKIEVYFHDTGDTGQLDTLLAQANKVQKSILRALHATRKFNLAHYTVSGIKLTLATKPTIEILTKFEE